MKQRQASKNTSVHLHPHSNPHPHPTVRIGRLELPTSCLSSKRSKPTELYPRLCVGVGLGVGVITLPHTNLSADRQAQTHTLHCGERGIRTPGTCFQVRRFSKPVVSATHPPHLILSILSSDGTIICSFFQSDRKDMLSYILSKKLVVRIYSPMPYFKV